MITRGALRTSIPPEMSKPVGLRSSGGQSILKELSNELVAVDVEDAVRLNASAMAVQVYIGGQHEHQSIGNLVKVVDAGNRHGIPTLAVTGVGKELVRDAKYLGLATRICAEMGAHIVKTYYCDKGFARVAAACPVPLVIAGGKKLQKMDALKQPTHKEPGCIRYELNEKMDEPRWITYIEKWKDKKVFDEHCAMPYITHFFNDVQPGLVEKFEVKLYKELLP